jgi:hypothetical protein
VSLTAEYAENAEKMLTIEVETPEDERDRQALEALVVDLD